MKKDTPRKNIEPGLYRVQRRHTTTSFTPVILYENDIEGEPEREWSAWGVYVSDFEMIKPGEFLLILKVNNSIIEVFNYRKTRVGFISRDTNRDFIESWLDKHE